MKKIGNTSYNNTNDDLIFVNSFGVLFNNALILHLFNKNTPINLEQIRKIVIVKKRVLFTNYIIFLSAITALIVAYYIQDSVDFKIVIATLLLAAILFLVSFIVKINEYKMVVLRHEREPIKVEFTNHFKKDAIIIMQKVNKHLKHIEKLSAAFNVKKSM